jgi:hypothetical protein
MCIPKLVLVIHESIFWKSMYVLNCLTNCFPRVSGDGVVDATYEAEYSSVQGVWCVEYHGPFWLD